jgi:uncharacterized membrane protein
MEEKTISLKKSTLWKSTAVIVGLIFIIFLFKGGFGLSGKSVQDSGKDVLIPLSDISEKAKFYEYEGIRYFVIKASDGSIKTAFDACDVCYSSRKGYRQEGNYMICNNCGNKYPIDGLGTENKRGGGCWPGYLPSSIEGDNLLIKASDIEKGEYRF